MNHVKSGQLEGVEPITIKQNISLNTIGTGVGGSKSGLKRGAGGQMKGWKEPTRREHKKRWRKGVAEQKTEPGDRARLFLLLVLESSWLLSREDGRSDQVGA